MLSQLKKLFALLNKRDKLWLIVILAFMLLASALEVISIGSVPLAIMLVADPVRLQSFPLISDFTASLTNLPRSKLVIWAGLGFMLVFTFRTVILLLSKYMLIRFAASRQVRISTELFRRYLFAPYLYHLSHNSSELIRNIQVGAIRAGSVIITRLLGGIQNVLILLAVMLLLFLAEPLVTLVCLLVFGVAAVSFMRLTASRTRALGQLEMTKRREALQILRQTLEGIREIRLLGKSNYFIQAFHERIQNVAFAQRDKQILTFLSGPLLEILALLTLLVITFSLLALGRDMAETVALLGLYAIAFVRIKSSLAAVLRTFTNLAYSLVAIDPVYDGLKNLPGIESEEACSETLYIHEQLQLSNVSFSYPEVTDKVIDDLSLDIPKGSYIGLVGATGSGKSTLINLLTGILQPESGRVLVDGHDIQRKLSAWQRNIGYVPQDLFLMDDTIIRNIAIGVRDENIDSDRVLDALRKACLLDFIQSLPVGLETMVGERGVRLSGGQKQRISIARALYRNPGILILDEATASLDHKTELEFLDAIRMLRNQITIISVAHRLSTLEECDSIYEFSKGRLVKKSFTILQAEASKKKFWF